jgi:RNA polymerase sigma-70 factor (ECF subfamily)
MVGRCDARGAARADELWVFMAADTTGDPQDLADALHAAQKGDEPAFRTIYRAHQPALLRYLTVLVGADAEDVASEAWLQIARDLRSFSGDWDGFRGWAATIARHRAMDHLRRLRRRPVSAGPVELHAADLVAAPDAADLAMETIGTDAAVALIASLPRDQAEAVMLRAVVGLDAESAGKVLGKRAGAVRTAAYRGLRTLSRRLEQGAGPPENNSGRGVTGMGMAALKGVR